MTYMADLHIHSAYAYATSKLLTFENLARWAKLKGIDVLASADFTHPVWFAESRAKLREADGGLYEFGGTLFMLGTEVSCVARVGGRARRVHMLAFAPSLDAAERANRKLAARGAKLAGDGRPTLRLSPRDFAELMLDSDPRCFVIPAHVWTPWYGLLGSKSGFDSLEECFGDLAPSIPAVETGLSSDPAMCWRVPELDALSIVSFSDAHSLPKLARELTAFHGEPSYDGILDALRSRSVAYTLEFFPEEGKYHNSGHRKCGVSLSPAEVKRVGRACPACGRAMTLGVTQRVERLAGRDAAARASDDGFIHSASGPPRPPFKSLISLDMLLSEVHGVGVNAKRVRRAYMTLAEAFGSELAVLMDAPIADIARAVAERGDRLAEGIQKMRDGDIRATPGFDGRYGVVRALAD